MSESLFGNDDTGEPGHLVGGVACSVCGSGFVTIGWQQIAGGRYHLRADCAVCGRYVKYLPQTPSLIELAGPKPSG